MMTIKKLYKICQIKFIVLWNQDKIVFYNKNALAQALSEKLRRFFDVFVRIILTQYIRVKSILSRVFRQFPTLVWVLVILVVCSSYTRIERVIFVLKHAYSCEKIRIHKTNLFFYDWNLYQGQKLIYILNITAIVMCCWGLWKLIKIIAREYYLDSKLFSETERFRQLYNWLRIVLYCFVIVSSWSLPIMFMECDAFGETIFWHGDFGYFFSVLNTQQRNAHLAYIFNLELRSISDSLKPELNYWFDCQKESFLHQYEFGEDAATDYFHLEFRYKLSVLLKYK